MASSGQPRLVGLGHAMEGVWPHIGSVVSSTRVWGPVVPGRVWARLGSALHDENPTEVGFMSA